MDSSQLKSVLLGDVHERDDRSTEARLEEAGLDSYKFRDILCIHDSLSQCAVLSALGLVYNSDLHILIDPKSHTAILSGTDVDADTNRQCLPPLLSSILERRLPAYDHTVLRAHLTKNYPLITASSPETLCTEIWERRIIPASVPGLLPPDHIRFCVLCKRGYVHAPGGIPNGLSKHKGRPENKDTHKDLNVRKAPAFFGVHLFGDNRRSYGLVAKVTSHSPPPPPIDTSPPPHPSAPTSSISAIPGYILKMGWPQYLALQSEAVHRLAFLVESARSPFSWSRIEKESLCWSEPNDRVEIILSALRRALVAYVEEGESRLRGARPEIRALVTHSSVISHLWTAYILTEFQSEGGLTTTGFKQHERL